MKDLLPCCIRLYQFQICDNLSQNDVAITVREASESALKHSVFWGVERGVQSTPLLTCYCCLAAPTEPPVPLKSHANVIYVPKLATSTAHPPPRIFACEDCTATPVRRWRMRRSGMYPKEIHIHRFVLESLRDTIDHRVRSISAWCIYHRIGFVLA